jgi:hypothetical protein
LPTMFPRLRPSTSAPYPWPPSFSRPDEDTQLTDSRRPDQNLDCLISVTSEALEKAKYSRDANAALLAQYATVLSTMLKQEDTRQARSGKCGDRGKALQGAQQGGDAGDRVRRLPGHLHAMKLGRDLETAIRQALRLPLDRRRRGRSPGV